MPPRDRALARALELAERHAGVGWGADAPGWVRDRVLAVLEEQAVRHKLPVEAVVERLPRDAAALGAIVGALRVGETRFYRDPPLWEAIEGAVLPAIPGSVEILALSAGCSTGEEAYTLAMLLAAAGRRARVVGVDRAGDAIATARAGVYGAEAACDLPPAWIDRFLEPGPCTRVAGPLRASVSFEQLDLVQRSPWGPFHIILFRNVLLYLAPKVGEAVASRLVGELEPGGHLFVASSEVPRVRAAGLPASLVAPGVTAFRRPRRWGVA